MVNTDLNSDPVLEETLAERRHGCWPKCGWLFVVGVQVPNVTVVTR